MKLPNFIMRMFETQRVSVKILPVQATKLRLHEWRADKGLCVSANKILNDPTVQLMVSVLHTEHPAFIVLVGGTALQDRAVYQARCEGYTMALGNLEAMAIHQELKNLPEPEFAPEELERH